MNEPQETPTPRTSAFYLDPTRNPLVIAASGFDFACDLERELSTANARLLAAEAQVAEMQISFHKVIRMCRQAAHDQYGNAEAAEQTGCVRECRNALSSTPSEML